MIPADKLGYYMSTRTIEIAPLAYMRGRTLDNAFIILDEAQNANDLQIKMFLTRIGANAKAIITGDPTQIDLPDAQSAPDQGHINQSKNAWCCLNPFLSIQVFNLVGHNISRFQKLLKSLLQMWCISSQKGL